MFVVCVCLCLFVICYGFDFWALVWAVDLLGGWVIFAFTFVVCFLRWIVDCVCFRWLGLRVGLGLFSCGVLAALCLTVRVVSSGGLFYLLDCGLLVIELIEMG